ncbi:MAG TPA: MASE1 domain-containing protein, partial [Steroidobacteraceae bacterium]|nr:MASE1 domain-containing protein [Steroidobacteraceae bacterium]
MSRTAVPDETRRSGIQQEFANLSVGQRCALYAALVLFYLLLVLAGLSLREKTENLTIIWPAAGLLFMVLWRLPRRLWIWIVATQVAIELGISAFHSDHFTILEYAPFALANSIDGMVGAFVASRLIPNPVIPGIRIVLQFIAAVAIGAAASAVLGAFASTHTLGGAHYLREWQLWWAGNWLGSVCIAPILMGWIIRIRARELSAPAAPPVEIMLIGGGLLAMTIWVFSAPPSGITTILDMPFSILALVVVAAFRFPPRWSTLLAAAVALLASYYASRNLGPFAGDPSAFVRVGAAQLNIAAIVVLNFMLTVVLHEMRNTFTQLRTSDERYRNFIEQSSEAVWRIELDVP